MRDLISIRELEKTEIEKILSLSEQMDKNSKSKKLNDKILVTLFFEPSTRTRLSFQVAATRLGMDYIDFSPETSSLKKGESFIDTLKVVSGYADLLVVRHPKEGSARLAADISETPIINGGDGGNQHPTQTLIDLYTIKRTKGTLNKLNVTLVGDLKHARTMHSLIYALSMYNNDITLISPEGLEMEEGLIKEVENKFGAKIKTKNELNFKDADVLYVCRIQEERFADPYEAKRIKEQFAISNEHLKNVRDELVILHPLPKINEITNDIDKTKYAKYFEQAHYGVPVRMAIIDYVLGK